MTHYQTLGVNDQADAEAIDSAYKASLTKTEDKSQLEAIEKAYSELSNPFRRNHYDMQLDTEKYVAAIDRSTPYIKVKTYNLLPAPHDFNHYEFINQLFNISPSDGEYLTPGQSLSDSDRNRIHWQLQPILDDLYAQKRETAEDKKQLDLLLKNESKIKQVDTVLTTHANEKCLYDLSLGPKVVQFTQEMRDMAQLIGGWEEMAEWVKRHPDLSSANALFAMRKAGCLNPKTFSLFMTCENSIEFSAVSDVVRDLSLANLLTVTNFEHAISHKKYARPLARGLHSLGFAGLLNQQTFEQLVSTGEQADQIAVTLGLLVENDLLNPTIQKRIIKLGQKNKSILTLYNNYSVLLQTASMTSEDRLALQWKVDTPELQALSLRIDKMFAYGFNLLAEDDKDKAQVVFSLALDLKKSLQTHFNQTPEEQLRTENEFKKQFLVLLHTQDKSMAEHREEWKVVVANVAIAFTGVGLFILGAYYWSNGHCFWATTQRENLRDDIASSPWLQQPVR